MRLIPFAKRATPAESAEVVVVINDPNIKHRLDLIEFAAKSVRRACTPPVGDMNRQHVRDLARAANRLAELVDAADDIPFDLLTDALNGRPVELAPEPTITDDTKRIGVQRTNHAWGPEWACAAGQKIKPVGCERHPHHYMCDVCEGYFGVPHDDLHTGPRAHVIGGEYDPACACTPCKKQTGRA